jgi:hypothetical protein
MESDNLHHREARLAAKHLAEVELTNARTAMVKLRAERDALVVAKARGDLIDRRQAHFALGFLLTGCRQRLLSFSYSLPPRLVGKDAHTIGMIVKEEVHSLLHELARLPSGLEDPTWVDRIDEDFRPVEEKGTGNGDKDKERAQAQRQRYNERRRERRATAKEA